MRERIAAELRAAGCVFAEDEAALLVAAARTPEQLAELVARRVAGAPLEPLLGWVAFCGLRLSVEPGVFVPRRRTEFLARRAITLTPTAGVVVELCCGAGAVAAAVRAARPDAELHAVDVEPAAVECARRNLAGPASVYAGDLYAPLPERLRGRIHVLVANAPYVPSAAIATMPPEARLHEPRVALDGGPDGLDVHRRIAADAPHWLRPGGYLLVETGRAQAAGTAALAEAAGLSTRVARDEQLGATVVLARWPSWKLSAPGRQIGR